MSGVYFKNLDGLRFFAFLSVFLYHSLYSPFSYIKESFVFGNLYWLTRGGHLGVNFFFVLSGFLITYLLMDEKRKTQQINIGKFYLRRVLRIWPLYYLILLICFILFPIVRAALGDHPAPEKGNPWLYIGFLSNFDNIYNGTEVPALWSMWSISVEEQFYLFWPLVLKLSPQRWRWVPMCAIVLMSLVIRSFHLDNYNFCQFHTLSVISDMAVGGLMAWAAFTAHPVFSRLRRLKKMHIALVYLVGFALVLTRNYWIEVPALFLFERLILSLFFAFIIFEQTFLETSFFKVGNSWALTQLGRISYGLYCYHYLVLMMMFELTGKLKWDTTLVGTLFFNNLLALAITVVISYLSYRFFESWFLNLKDKFDYSRKPVKRQQQAQVERI